MSSHTAQESAPATNGAAVGTQGRQIDTESSNGIYVKANHANETRINGVSVHGSSPVQLVDRFIDEPRPLQVAVIGGGLAGILAGVLLPKKVPNIELTIFEKNGDFVSLRGNLGVYVIC